MAFDISALIGVYGRYTMYQILSISFVQALQIDYS